MSRTFDRSGWVLCLVLAIGLGSAPRGSAVWGADEEQADAKSSEEPAAGGKKAEKTSTDEEVIDYINRLLRQGWKDSELAKSKEAEPGEFCRRVYLDVVGRIPTDQEVEQYLGDRSKNRKAKLVDRLLSEEYVEEYARNWTTIWTNVLIGRTGGSADNTNIIREGMQQFLRRSMLNNKPLDQMSVEIVAAEGVNKPGEDGYNGAVNFTVDNLTENAANATAKTARIFLGLQVQCTQCHNHPFNEWKQDQFWSLNAFYRQTTLERLSDRRNNVIPTVRLQDRDFTGEAGGGGIEEANLFYEQRNGALKSALPRFVDGTTISPHGSVSMVNRRKELANLIQQSPYLPKAMVNRVWGHFYGYGFTKPVDDMGPHNLPSHPELLEKLAADFGNHGFDQKLLIRWIALSEGYGLSSKIVPGKKGNERDDPMAGERPMFSHFYLRQMRPEELYESLVTATKAAEGGGSYEEQELKKNMWLQQFSIAFGTDDGAESTTFNGTIPQTLMMMNGDLIRKATSGDPGTFLHEVVTSGKKDAEKVRQLYLAAMARTPSKDDAKLVQKAYEMRSSDKEKGDPAAGALQDIWWALLNSNEFIFNH